METTAIENTVDRIFNKTYDEGQVRQNVVKESAVDSIYKARHVVTGGNARSLEP